MNFDPSPLRFIETRSPEDKRPKKSWGGYSQDFDDAEHVHTHEEIQKFPHGNWAVVDVEDQPHSSLSLLVFDLDVHKAPDDFDPTDITIPSDTLVVESQSGGLHIYFIVHARRSELNESDFSMTEDLGWDIDIRGSSVGAHVVAPSDIPGVDTPYNVVNDEPIKTVFDPTDAAERIRIGGAPLLEFSPGRGSGGNIEIDRDVEPPEEMPLCYHRALQSRKANPDDPDTNTHKVNVLTGLCGLAAGYDVETMVDHFCDGYAPGENADRERTKYQLSHLADRMDRGDYSPPAISTLRAHGILDEGESCDCEIDYHGGEQDDEGLPPAEIWQWWADKRKSGDLGPESIIPTPALRHVAEEQGLYNFDALSEEQLAENDLPAKAQNKALEWVNNRWTEQVDVSTDDDGNATIRKDKYREADACLTWEDVRYVYEEDKNDGRSAARSLLKDRFTFMSIQGSEELQVYDPETGAFTDSLGEIRGQIYDGLEPGGHWSTHEKEEILAGLRQHNQPRASELNGRAKFDNPHLCLENGVLDLFEEDLKDHSPDHYFTDRVPHKYNPKADSKPYEAFLDDVTARPEDAKAMIEMVGHALTRDAHGRGWKNFMVLFGGADNGKSVFYDLVSHLLEGDADDVQNVMSVKLGKMSSNRFSKNSMYGSMANIAGEINGKKIRNTADIKDIPGGDKMEIEPKGGESMSDTMNTTLMFAANDPPIIGERDKEAISSRIVPIELPNKFVDEPDPDDPHQKQKRPESKLKEELLTDEAISGFLNMALEGIDRLRENEGDVSLPESNEERLAMYEKNADPMKEFGQECLENGTDDYVVKADITTIYKEFAASRGYETGSNVHKTLHGALSGMQTLHYTESRPENPDYKGTTLPLRGWDERKRVADRVSLTETGLEYARSAGLVEEQGEQDNDQEQETKALAALGPARDLSFTAEVVAVSDGEYTREAQGLLKGSHGTPIGFAVPGDNENPLSGQQGETYQFETVTIRTDEDGLREAVINDAVTLTELEGQQSSLERTTEAQRATDGGAQEADLEGAKPKIKEHLRTECEADDVVTVTGLAGQNLDLDPNTVEDTLEALAREEGLLDRYEDEGYRVF